MSSFLDKPVLRRRKLWLFLAFLVVMTVSFPAWRWYVDPRAPGGLVYKFREYRNRISFNSEKWRAFPRSTNEWPHTRLLPIRIRMVDDLLKRHDFNGQTREEVEKLLGPKTKTEYFSDWDLVYYLGPGRYGNAVGDSEWLVFRLDNAGRVKDFRVVHD